MVGLKKELREDEETILKLSKVNKKPITYAQGQPNHVKCETAENRIVLIVYLFYQESHITPPRPCAFR